jgi:hypothetical protein
MQATSKPMQAVDNMRPFCPLGLNGTLMFMKAISIAMATKLGYLPVRSGNKHRNTLTEYNGRKYHSRKEAEFAQQLDCRLKAKDITAWSAQVKYTIEINGHKICDYFLDFQVYYPDGRIEYIDIKPFDKKTQKFLKGDVYKLKKKMMKACHDIDIVEL